MSTRYIALLRGINVGSHKAKMEQLRSLFEELGFSNVGSYINSGNIFFDAGSDDRQTLSDTIERHLNQALGFAVPVFLRTPVELKTILSSNPFKGIERTKDTRFCVVFTKQTLSDNVALPMSSTKNDMDLVAIGPHEGFVVWHIINGRPPSGKFPADVLPMNNTTRFFHTLAKILQAAISAT